MRENREANGLCNNTLRIKSKWRKREEYGLY